MAHKYDTSEFRNGLKVEIDGQPYAITYFQFVKPGKGTAFTRTKMKNLITGSVIDPTFRSGEKVDAAEVEEIEMTYMYEDGENHHFMNQESGEQYSLISANIEDESKYFINDISVKVLFFKGRPISVQLPNFIEDEIEYTEPAVKGNTATGATKTATLKCGAAVQVPLFVEQGEVIRVDTRTAEYVARVNAKK